MTEAAASRARFALLVAFVAIAITAPRLWLHELWRDEAWVWLVAIDSGALAELFTQLARSGQGYVYPLLCWFLSKLSHAPWLMQALNLVLVGASTWVLVRFAPFRRLECLLVASGYYVFYEYAVISRHYTLGVLLTFAAAASGAAALAPSVDARTTGRRLVVFGVALALLFQVTVYSTIIGIALAAGFVLARGFHPGQVAPVPKRALLVAVAIAALGFVAGIAQLMPTEGTTFAVGWITGWDEAHALSVLQAPWHAFVPITSFDTGFWNNDLLAAKPDWQALAGVAALGLATIILWPRKLALAIFAMGTVAMLAFGYVKYVGLTRHHAHLWLLLVAALWLDRSVSIAQPLSAARRGIGEWLLLAVLVFQSLCTAWASWIDARAPFSNGDATAALIRANALDAMPMLGYREPPAASVSLALGAREMYSPSHDDFRTHTDWGPLQRDLQPQELRCAARRLAAREGRDVLLVLNAPIPHWPELQPVAAATGAIVPTENYWLHRLVFAQLPATLPSSGCPN